MIQPLREDPCFSPCPVDDGDELFPNGIFVFNVSRILEYLENPPADVELVEIPVCHLDQGFSSLDESNVDSADLGHPVVLAEISPGQYNLIDGHHRVEKALRQGAKSLPAYRLTVLQHIRFLTSKDAYRSYISYWNGRVMRALLVLLISVTTSFAGDFDHAAFKQLRDFIHTLPARERVVADVALFRSGPSTEAQKREATERLKKAKEGFDRLKTLVRVGTSVFDYPGLIALARPRHSETDNTYSIVLGIPPGWNWTHEQGTNENEYEIFFDNRGLITELRPVIYRH